MNVCEIFKRKFKELRVKSSLTQDNLSTELGVSRSCIMAWENGAYSPSLANIEKIANFFKVSPVSLISEKELVSNTETIASFKLEELLNEIKTRGFIISLS